MDVFDKIFDCNKRKKQDRKIDIKFINVKLKLCELVKLYKPKKDTAPSVGIDIKKDNFAASNLLKFKKREAVIVIPDLLTQVLKTKFENNQ